MAVLKLSDSISSPTFLIVAESQAPFEEKPVAADSRDPAAVSARSRLQAALDQLNPAGGILDDGDGTGRHANRKNKQKTN